jgi:hypothetical protein
LFVPMIGEDETRNPKLVVIFEFRFPNFVSSAFAC